MSPAVLGLRPFYPLSAEGLAALKAQEAALPAGQHAAQQSQLPVLYFESRLRSGWQARSAQKYLPRCPADSPFLSVPHLLDIVLTLSKPQPYQWAQWTYRLREFPKARCLKPD